MKVYCPVCRAIGDNEGNEDQLVVLSPKTGGLMVGQCERCMRVNKINTKVFQIEDVDYKSGELKVTYKWHSNWDELPLKGPRLKMIEEVRDDKNTKRSKLMKFITGIKSPNDKQK